MIDTLENSFIKDLTIELQNAEMSHKPMNSLHEAYAVILEELDELWGLCRLKCEERKSEDIREELLQIAAMAWRTARDLNLEAGR